MISPSSAQNNDLRPAAPLKIASIFQRHQLKFLNLGLVIYLCFGVLLFESLGEFNVQDGPKSIIKSDTSRPLPAPARNSSSKLVELRELSARRMWNITNRLNILYESNWTRLMLDELQEFERQLLDKLVEEALADRESEQREEKQDEDDDKDSDQEKRRKKQSERDSKNRIKSLKKSLIHSLSTITTVGFTQRIGSSAGKLATVIYGLLGIPLLVCSVAKTGKQVAHSTRNGLLILRHYCFSLPIHYLCCSCSLGGCFRCLLWCCCCCCCSYLCCCLTDKQRRGNKCCDPSKAPKLRLHRGRRGRRKRSRDGASRSIPSPGRQAAFVIGATSRSDEHEVAAEQQLALAAPQQQQQQQKSVRFEQNAKHKKSKSKDHDDDYEEEDPEDNYEDDLGYTQGVFFTSLSALSLYLLLGAYFYATYTDSPLIDALFVCYSMLSTSKFPSSSNAAADQQIYSNPRILYEHLNASSSTQSNFQASGESIESETVKWIYLLVGLNLVSACGHFAQLWLSNKLKLEECPLASSSDKKKKKQQQQPICNGQQIIHGSYQMPNESHANNQQAAPPIGVGGELQLVASQIMTSADFGNHHHPAAYQRHSDQVDLSELFLVQQNHQPAADGSSPENNGMQFVAAGQLQPASDVSLTSDRSTDRASLCHHHHKQQHHHQMQQPAVDNLYQSHHSICNTGSLKHHHRHPSQGHLYLPSTMNCVAADQQQITANNHHQFIPELDCEESVEMDMMLKSCMQNGAKLRSSSSSTQLSSHPISGQSNHQHQHHLAGATNNSRLSFDKQNGGQDSSLNDGSNTMSSTTSSRTVKLPHMRSNQHIGFILAPDQQANLNKQ